LKDVKKITSIDARHTPNGNDMWTCVATIAALNGQGRKKYLTCVQWWRLICIGLLGFQILK